MRHRLAAGSAVAAVLLTAGCGGSSDASGTDPDAGDFSAAADTSTCVADATQVASFPDGYPKDFPLPDGTVLYNVQDRGADGVVATGVTSTAFQDVLKALNGPAQKAGYQVSSGETEDHDAEANWSGNGFTGRWAIKESATCPGETVVQLLSKKG
jgi:hypothetical protein